MADAPEEVRRALIGDIAHALDFAMYHAKGMANGYGLGASDLAELREALECIVDGLARTPVKLLRPEVRHASAIEKKARAAMSDEKYLEFKYFKLLPRRSWKGNKAQRAEVEALYKPEGGAARGASHG